MIQKPFEQGRTYKTQGGKDVTIVAVKDMFGKPSTVEGDDPSTNVPEGETPHGIHRYNRPGIDMGRVTGTAFGCPDNLIPEMQPEAADLVNLMRERGVHFAGVYVQQFGAFWLLPMAEWIKIVRQGLDVDHFGGYDLPEEFALRGQPKKIGKMRGESRYYTKTNDIKLVQPLDWGIQDWIDEVGDLKLTVAEMMDMYYERPAEEPAPDFSRMSAIHDAEEDKPAPQLGERHDVTYGNKHVVTFERVGLEVQAQSKKFGIVRLYEAKRLNDGRYDVFRYEDDDSELVFVRKDEAAAIKSLDELVDTLADVAGSRG